MLRLIRRPISIINSLIELKGSAVIVLVNNAGFSVEFITANARLLSLLLRVAGLETVLSDEFVEDGLPLRAALQVSLRKLINRGSSMFFWSP